MGYHHPGDASYTSDQYGQPHQYYSGYYTPSDMSAYGDGSLPGSIPGSFHGDGSFNGDGSFHESIIFDSNMHVPTMHSYPMSQTPSRYPGGDQHHHVQYPTASPYWGHLNISQLPGVAASPSIHITPSKPPRGANPNRSQRKQQQQRGSSGHNQHRGQAKGAGGGHAIDGKAKSLIMFPNQTGSPASRFVMSPQDKSNPYYTAKMTQRTSPPSMRRNGDANAAPRSSASTLDQSVGTQEESFVLPAIEDYSPESPGPADKAAGHTSLQGGVSNTSMDMMPPLVKKMYMGSSSRRNPQDGKLGEVSESP